MTKEMARTLGGKIENVEEVDGGRDGDCLGKFLRVRVNIDVNKPQRKYIQVQHPNSQDQSTLPLVYERLPEFCFKCRRLGHDFRECNRTNQPNTGTQNVDDMAYGNWMRASALQDKGRGRNPKEKGKEERTTGGEGSRPLQQQPRKSQIPSAEPVLSQEEDQSLELQEEESGRDIYLGAERTYLTEAIGLHINEDVTKQKAKTAERNPAAIKILPGEGIQMEVNLTGSQNKEVKTAADEEAQKFGKMENQMEGQGPLAKKAKNGAHIQIILNAAEKQKKLAEPSYLPNVERQHTVQGQRKRWKRRIRGNDQQEPSLKENQGRKRDRSREGREIKSGKRIQLSGEKVWETQNATVKGEAMSVCPNNSAMVGIQSR